jgi:beta-phosphoglucomutase
MTFNHPGTDYAVIFDMDGVLVDNMEFHKKAWKKFMQKYSPDTNLKEFSRHFGKTNGDLIEILFNHSLTQDEIQNLAEEKEAMYRDIYAPFVSPTPGLISFLRRLEDQKTEMVVATSAPDSNVNFVMNKTGLRKYFKRIIDSSQIRKGKPDPEIYRLAAGQTRCPVMRCLVFEDSCPGIESARKAGMKVIGVATTYSPEKLKGAERIIRDFTKISPDDVRAVLF